MWLSPDVYYNCNGDCKEMWYNDYCGGGNVFDSTKCNSGTQTKCSSDPPPDPPPYPGTCSRTVGDKEYCDGCKCGLGEGDCDGIGKNKQCVDGLICWDSVGYLYSLKDSLDLCLPTDFCLSDLDCDPGYTYQNANTKNAKCTCEFDSHCINNKKCYAGFCIEPKPDLEITSLKATKENNDYKFKIKIKNKGNKHTSNIEWKITDKSEKAVFKQGVISKINPYIEFTKQTTMTIPYGGTYTYKFIVDPENKTE